MSIYSAPQRAANGAFKRSLSGVRQLPRKPPIIDSQLAMAILRRVGLGKFIGSASGPTGKDGNGNPIGGGYLISPSGPLIEANPISGFTNTTIAPLYQVMTGSITWDSGASANLTISYDVTNQDMSYTYSYSWKSSTVVTNTAPGFPGFLSGGDNPGDPPAINHQTYGHSAGPDSSTIADTSISLTWNGYTDDSGVYHFGCTLVFSLSDPFQMSDYAAVCNGFLSQMTFDDQIFNPSKTYSLYNETGQNDFWFTTMAAMFINFSLPNKSYYSTSVLWVKYSRESGYQFYMVQPPVNNSCFINFPYGSPYPFNTDVLDPNTGLPVNKNKTILSASGMPFPPPGSVVALPTAGFLDPTALPTPTDLVAYIWSAKSSITPPFGLSNGQQIVYDPAANSFSVGSFSLPDTTSKVQFNPSTGLIIGVFDNPTYVEPEISPGSNPPRFSPNGASPTANVKVLTHGTLYTFNSVSNNAGGQFFSIQTATWVVNTISGNAPTLVVAPDGKSATIISSVAAPYGVHSLVVSAAGLASWPLQIEFY
jgi:hypothetical protein